MWKKFGGFIKIVTVITLAVAIIAIWQDNQEYERQATVSATQFAIMGEELQLGREVATIQAGGAASPPTATAAAARIAQLEETAAALATVQAQLQVDSLKATTVPPEWNERANNVPSSGTQITRELAAGEFVYLSGGRFSLNGVFCGNDATQICVLIFGATYPQHLTIDQLIARNNYLARTSAHDYQDLLRIHQPFFWEWPNCQSQSGCARATVYYFEDGNLLGQPTRIDRP